MEPDTTAVPSLSTETGNAILSAFLDASTPIEHIAQEFSLTVGTLLTWLRQHQQLITELTTTLEQRAKLLALRAEVIAMDVLRQIAELSRDPEARRKAASKLLSHIKAPSPRMAARPSEPPSSIGGAHSLHAQRTPGASPGPHAPSPCSTTAKECSPRATNVAGSAASLVPLPAQATDDAHAASSRLHAEGVNVSSRRWSAVGGATPPEREPHS